MNTQSSPISVDCLYKGGDIITSNKTTTIIENAAIAVKDGIIVAIGTVTEVMSIIDEPNEIFDFSGLTLMPGLIDGHTHLFQSIGKTLGDGLTLLPWLETFMLPLAASLTKEDAVKIIRLASLQSLSAGTTTMVDNHYAPVDEDTILASAAIMEEVGVRGAIARGIFGPFGEGAKRMNCDPRLFSYSASEEINITKNCIKAHPKGSRIEVWPMPENIVYVDPDLIVACHELAVSNDIGWQMHCSESSFEVDIFESIHGIRPAIWMDNAGILTDNTSLAHGIWFDEAEIQALGAGKTTIVHNPVSNQYLASGIIKLQPLIDAGANITLATDGTACGGQNMFEAMKSSLLLQRMREYDSSATTAEMMFSLATKNGGKLMRQNVGYLKVGAKADFIMIDMKGLHHQPSTRPITGLVLSAQGNDVRHVVVEGEVVIKNGHSTRVDEEQVIADALQATGDLIKRAGLSHLL
jgi:5-methylthioadenosine/S-adenosylhomocysteine deaminase